MSLCLDEIDAVYDLPEFREIVICAIGKFYRYDVVYTFQFFCTDLLFTDIDLRIREVSDTTGMIRMLVGQKDSCYLFRCIAKRLNASV